MNKILLIDTSSNKEIIVGLRINGKKYLIKQQIERQKVQVVLPIIDKLLKKHSIKLEDIGEIEVNTIPGSFTGLRVGMAIANALAFVLKIPVNGRKIMI